MARSSAALVIAIGALSVLSTIGLGALIQPAGVATARPAGSLAPTLVTDAVPVPFGTIATSLPGTSKIALTLTLAGADPAGLGTFLRNVEDPSSLTYRQFLTAAQFEASFAPSPATAESVVAAVTAAGGQQVTVSPGRLAVTAVLPASAVAALLGVHLERIGGTRSAPEYTASGTPSLPPALRGTVVGIGGLSNAADSHFSYELTESARARAAGHPSPSEFVLGNPSGEQLFIGSDFTQAYGATTLFPGNSTNPNASFPSHVAIATLLASGYNSTESLNLPPWDPAVVDWYLNQTLAPWWPSPTLVGVPVTAEGITPPPPGANGGLNDSSLDQVENSLDLEMAGSLAPGAPVYNFYFAGSLLTGAPALSNVADAFAADLGAALNYNYGPARLGVVSGSFGLSDTNDSLWDAALGEAAATGVTVVAASGDQGNAPNNLSGRADGQWPTWPGTAASDYSGSIAVGGVSLSLAGRPAGSISPTGELNLTYDRNVTGISGMTTWYDTTGGRGNFEGSEGGISPVYPLPAWQFFSAANFAIVNATTREGLHSLGRAEPDISFPGNSTLTMYGANATSGVFYGSIVEGTSIAAPVFAGLLADLIAVKSNDTTSTWHSFGFLDPELYRIGSYFAAYASAADPYYDVTVGGNYVFSAGPGWDPTTGWGGISAPLFLAADANRTVSTYAYTGPTRNLPSSPSSASLPWTDFYLVVGVGLAAAVVLVVLMARPRRPANAPVPYGAQTGAPPNFGPGAQGGIYPGATFLCPYCGGVRPAEPVRCPQCGAY
jgi:kumamolisin